MGCCEVPGRPPTTEKHERAVSGNKPDGNRIMGKIIIKTDWVPNNFGAAPLNENIACVATGTTLEDVKKNIVEALEFHIEGMKADGDTIPEELSSPWEPEFQLTTRALLKYSG